MNIIFEINDIVNMIKMLAVTIGTFTTGIRLINEKTDKIKKFKIVVISILITLILNIVNKISGINGIVYAVVLVSISFSLILRKNIGYSIIISVISEAINQIIFFIALSISYIVNSTIVGTKNEYIQLSIILIIYILLMQIFYRVRRLKKGLAFLQERENNQYLDAIILNISVAIIFIITVIANYNQIVTEKMLAILIIFSIIMFITIQKSLQLYYKHKMLVKALEETQKELNEKKEEVKKLEKENLNFSQTSHSISHRQKSIEHKLNILLANNGNINSKDIENEIKNIRKELEIETKVELKKTGIAVIDDMLSYMQAECIKNNINFQLQISGNMYHMVNNYIDKSDLEILLADHIKDAIIAVNHVETNNKSILVRIGEIDGKYGVYFYDSGVEFTIGTLIKLGKVPVTTYKEEGGSGMGFMNSFNTLNKYKATLIIEELNKPTNDNFTKVLKFIFNEEEKFKILSYRNQEIANENNNKELIIEKLQK